MADERTASGIAKSPSRRAPNAPVQSHWQRSMRGFRRRRVPGSRPKPPQRLPQDHVSLIRESAVEDRFLARTPGTRQWSPRTRPGRETLPAPADSGFSLPPAVASVAAGERSGTTNGAIMGSRAHLRGRWWLIGAVSYEYRSRSLSPPRPTPAASPARPTTRRPRCDQGRGRVDVLPPM